MGSTKITKPKTTTKPAINLPISNPNVDISSQTPIEIALKIDENGMTTASNLYAFLELNPTQFSRWCKRNIVNNKFSTENVDYICFDISVESAVKGQTKTDYRITSDFAILFLDSFVILIIFDLLYNLCCYMNLVITSTFSHQISFFLLLLHSPKVIHIFLINHQP